MKKYSSKQAKKGKTAYRTPSNFVYKKLNIHKSFRKHASPGNKKLNRVGLEKSSSYSDLFYKLIYLNKK